MQQQKKCCWATTQDPASTNSTICEMYTRVVRFFHAWSAKSARTPAIELAAQLVLLGIQRTIDVERQQIGKRNFRAAQ